ncbi:MAG TPA: response regulator transcription factor [Candidatus Polarisedimenticolia bacterium]|nr:response regulator transcription factor [Candidatus Polarisedimenticolia bacterium]
MPPKHKTRVVIVDDHPLFREGLRHAIEGNSRFEVAAEAGRGETALHLILQEKPDVAVLDVNLPDMNGFELIPALRRKKCNTPVVILTMLKDEQAFNTALNLKVSGYVLKDNASAEILNCIEAVANGESYVSPSLTDFLLRRRSRAEQLAKKQPGLDDLTVAERRILKRISDGKTSREIAGEFFISPRTVESHRAHICEKLGLSGSNKLLHFALENRDALKHLE